MPDFDNFMWKLIAQCFSALWSHQGGQVPLMRTARELIRALPTQPGKHKVSMGGRGVWHWQHRVVAPSGG